MELVNLTWTEVEKYLEKHQTIIVPLGAVEQHGPAMPLGTDTMIGQALAVEVGRRSGRLVSPPLSPGISLTPHMEFKGTISFMPDTFTGMIRDFVESLYHHGFRTFLLINGHGGNTPAVKNAMVQLRYRLADIRYDFGEWWNLEKIRARSIEEVGHPVGHACTAETSLILFLNQSLVKTDSLTKEYRKRQFYVSNNLSSNYVTSTGLMDADQTKASGELGREFFELAVASYLELLAELEKA